MSTTNVTEVKQRHEQGEYLQLIDVRSPTEYAAGHLPGAVNIPMDQIQGRLADVDIRRPLVLVCQSGRRAAMTAEMLKPLGHDVLVLEGGTAAWLQAGHPVVGTTSTSWALDRQVRQAAGLIVVISCLLAVYVNSAWLYVAALVGAGLTAAAIANQCPMTAVLAKMPWNKPKSTPVASTNASCT